MLITNDQVDELVSVLADLSGLDEELVARCGGLIREQRYDEAVSRAFVVLEARMRELMGMSGGSGRQLVGKLFSEKDSQYVERLNLPEQEWQGIRSIFDGAFAAYRNRAAHTIAGYSLDEARAIVHLVNLLVVILRQIEQSPKQQVPEVIAQILGPAPAQRLKLFLDRLQEVGITREQGKVWLPYKTKLMYRAFGWDNPKPYRVAVFYLTKSRQPVLAFNSKGFRHTPGIDIQQLENQLLQTGCVRTEAKDVPVQLVLREQNSQVTFDRLYDILKDVVEKHSG